MALPSIPLPRSEVVLGDAHVEIKALTRQQALELSKYKDDADAAEAYIIACAVDVSMEEAQSWRASSTVADVGRLINAVIVLSGLATPEQLEDPLGVSPPKSAWSDLSSPAN